jgi:hypothetical protein
MGEYADQMSIDRLTMIGVSGMDIPRLAPTGQTRLLHHALHPFVIDLPALPSFALSSSDDSHSRENGFTSETSSPSREESEQVTEGWMENIRCNLTWLKRHCPYPEQVEAGYYNFISYRILLTMVPDTSKEQCY